MNTRITFVIFLLAVFTCCGQEVADADFNDDPETVFFNLEVFRPVGVGDSFLARDYNLGAGFAFDFNWFIIPNFTIGTQLNIFRGNVVNQSSIGNISSSSIRMAGFTTGYYYEIDRHWNIYASAGIGALKYRNRAPEDKFSERGTSYWSQVQVGYRFNKTAAVYFKMSPRYDRLRIESPAGMQGYFNRHFMLIPGFGVRLNLHNPGG